MATGALGRQVAGQPLHAVMDIRPDPETVTTHPQPTAEMTVKEIQAKNVIARNVHLICTSVGKCVMSFHLQRDTAAAVKLTTDCHKTEKLVNVRIFLFC